MKALKDEEMTLVLNNPLRIQELPEGAVIDFFLPREIVPDTTEYIDFMRALNDAKEGDKVTIHINCYGGDLDTTFQLIDTIHETKATVDCSVEGICASAATMIALAGDSFTISPFSNFMIHAWTKIAFGKYNELKSAFDFDERWLVPAFKEIYKGFLTDAEIERCLKGEDFYFTATETFERVQKSKKRDIERQELVNKIAEKYQKNINAEIEKELKKFDEETKKQNKNA